MARRAPEGLWRRPFGPDPEAGVLKKPRAQSPEISVSVCRPECLQKDSDFQLLLQAEKRETVAQSWTN